jgi:hypothetical protein
MLKKLTLSAAILATLTAGCGRGDYDEKVKGAINRAKNPPGENKEGDAKDGEPKDGAAKDGDAPKADPPMGDAPMGDAPKADGMN